MLTSCVLFSSLCRAYLTRFSMFDPRLGCGRALCLGSVYSCQNALELVHMDECQVHTKSHVGAQYFVTFIDGYSRKLWVFELKGNPDVVGFRQRTRRCPFSKSSWRETKGNQTEAENDLN